MSRDKRPRSRSQRNGTRQQRKNQKKSIGNLFDRILGKFKNGQGKKYSTVDGNDGERGSKRKKSIFESKKFLIALFVIGLMILIYPVISNKYYEIKQSDATDEYEKKMAHMKQEEIEKILKEARAYNKGLANIDDNGYSQAVTDYVKNSMKKKKIPSYFLKGEPIARLRVPAVNIDLPVYYGTTDDILRKGVGCMVNTSLPVGRPSTHSVLTGHRGLPESRLFRDLGELKKGDMFSIEILNRRLAYKVEYVNIVKPNDVSKIAIEKNKDLCTLLTCHPYMINSERMLVTGKRVPYVDYMKEAKKKDNLLNKLWLMYLKYKEYIYGILIALIVIALFGAIEKERKRISKKNGISRKKKNPGRRKSPDDKPEKK